MLTKGDWIQLPNGQKGTVQGWAVEKGILSRGKPYQRTSRKQAIASGSPLVEVCIGATAETEFWPLDALVYISPPSA